MPKTVRRFHCRRKGRTETDAQRGKGSSSVSLSFAHIVVAKPLHTFARYASDIEKHGFAFALKADIETIDVAFLFFSDKRGDAAFLFDAGKNRVGGIGLLFFREIHAGLEADIDAARDNPEGDVRRHRSAIAKRHLAGLDGFEDEFARIHVAGRAAPADEIRICLAPRFAGAVVITVAIRLPDFDQRVLQRHSRTVIDRAAHADAFAAGLVVIKRTGTEILLEHALDTDEIRCAADMHVRACRLRGSFFEIAERLNHGQLPSMRFSKRVERRPRRTISNL
ncbi:hypothetical protein AGR9A_Lc20185 [Agrobacterium salinitolerans str. Hayward 0363]|nr:hypothetical protein AGR9A_Lc20185 [Agrobacterium salinitolerans str. Hayward 0363]